MGAYFNDQRKKLANKSALQKERNDQSNLYTHPVNKLKNIKLNKTRRRQQNNENVKRVRQNPDYAAKEKASKVQYMRATRSNSEYAAKEREKN